MTLAELLNEDDVTSSAVVSTTTETTPHYISNADVDKLASLIESFAEKYENTLEEMSSMIDKQALFGKKTNTVATPTNAEEPLASERSARELKQMIEGEKSETRRLGLLKEYENLSQRNQAVREGGSILRRHPKATAAIIGGLGGAALMHQYDKQNQMGGA